MIKKMSCIFLILCVFFSNMHVPLAADKTLGQIKQELEQYKKDYEENKLQIELTEQEKKDTQNRINEINTRISEIGVEVQTLNEEIAVLNEEIIKNEQEIQDILAFVQIQNGESAYLEYAFGAQDFTDFIYRVAVSEQVTTYNDQLIETHKRNIEENKKKSEELATKKAELADEQENLKVELEKIQLSLQELDTKTLSIEELIEAKEQEIKVFTDNGCTDDQTLKQCQISILPLNTSFWRPLEKGVVTSEQGPRYPCGGAVSCYHNGIDLSISGGNSGTVPIYASASGIVTYITNYSGYACSPKKVFIQHNVNGEIYTTGYWHLYSMNVSVGDFVSKDTQVGTMGGFDKYDTCSTGAHLHFELSTGGFSGDSIDYYSNRFNPRVEVNFPTNKYVYWYDRITKH